MQQREGRVESRVTRREEDAAACACNATDEHHPRAANEDLGRQHEFGVDAQARFGRKRGP